jgi:hypothetical protein
VVRTFTRMALPAGRRDHFCLLALGVPVSQSSPTAHHGPPAAGLS